MATIQEKIVDMLATVRELRKIVTRKPIELLELIEKRGPIGQGDIIRLLPSMSPRTIRRKLDTLIQEGKIVRHKDGRNALYSINSNYPHA